MTYIGIDNGVSGTIGILTDTDSYFYETPVKKHLKYTKKKAFLSRIDHIELKKLFMSFDFPFTIFVERPMVNPKRFTASASALRALEATLIVLEQLGLPYEFIDSKEWQKAVLPKGIKGQAALKEASKLKGIQLYPMFKKEIEKHKDADGLLIAHYLKYIK